MKKVFALSHRPTFLSIEPDPIVGLFEDEQDAIEALQRLKPRLRKPYVKTMNLLDAEDCARENAEAVRLEKMADHGPDPIYRPDRGQYGSGNVGPGTTRSGRSYRGF